jgi:hypothetical protein
VRIDRAGRLHTFSRKPSRSQSLPLHLVPHRRMTARAPARSDECIDGDFKLMHYRADGVLYRGRPAVVSAHEAPALSGFSDDSEMDRSGR